MSRTVDTHLPDGRGLGRQLPDMRRKRAVRKALLALPVEQWTEFDDEIPLHIKNQDGKGACNGFACATIMEYARWVAGLPHVPLSGWFPYAIMCNGIDQGSMILDALELSIERGICEESLVPYGTINPRSLSQQSHENAKRYRMELGGQLETWLEIGAAVQLRHSVNLSLRAGPGFDDLDAEGVPSFTQGPGNHAVTVCGGAKKSKKHGWLYKMRNSWDTSWGIDGCCWLPEACWKRQTYREAYNIIGVHDDPLDPTNMPVVR